MKFSLIGLLLFLSYSIQAQDQLDTLHLEIHTSHTDDINCLSLSPDTRYFASGSSDNTIKIWDKGSNKTFKTLKGHSSAVQKIFFLSEDKLLSIEKEGNIFIWDVWKGTYSELPKKGVIESAVMDQSKTHLFISSKRDVFIIDLNTKEEIFIKRSSKYHPTIAIHPTEPFVAFESQRDPFTVSVWNYQSNRLIKNLISSGKSYEFLDFSPDGKRLLTFEDRVFSDADYESYRLKLWDCKSWILIDSINHIAYAKVMKFGRDENEILFNSALNSSTGTLFNSYYVDKKQYCLAVEGIKGKHITNYLTDIQYDSINEQIIVSNNEGIGIYDARIKQTVIVKAEENKQKNLPSYSSQTEMPYNTRYWIKQKTVTLLDKQNIFLKDESFNYSNVHNPNVDSSKLVVETELTFEKIAEYEKVAGDIENLKYFPQADLLVSVSIDGLRLWDLNTGRMSKKLDEHYTNFNFHANNFKVSNDGTKYMFSKNYVEVFSTTTHALLANPYVIEDVEYPFSEARSSDVTTGSFENNDSTLIVGNDSGLVTTISTYNWTIDDSSNINYQEEIVAMQLNENIYAIGQKKSFHYYIPKDTVWKSFDFKNEEIIGLKVSPKGRYICVWSLINTSSYLGKVINLKVFDTNKGELLNNFPEIQYNSSFYRPQFIIDFDRNDELIYFGTKKGVYCFNPLSNSTRIISSGSLITSIALDTTKNYLYTGNFEGRLQVINLLSNNELTKDTLISTSQINSIVAFQKEDRIAIGNVGGVIITGNVFVDSSLVKMYPIRQEDYITINDKNEYVASGSILNHVSLVAGKKQYSVYEFGQKFNRPESIAKSLGVRDNQVVNFFSGKRQSITRNQTLDSIPDVKIQSDVFPSFTNEKSLDITFELASFQKLKSWQIELNGIPLFGPVGVDISSLQTNSIVIDTTIELSLGINRIEIFAINERNVRSIKESIYVNNLEKLKVFNQNKTYLFAVGIADYDSHQLSHLKFADKDANDMIQSFTYASDSSSVFYKLTMLQKSTDVQSRLVNKNVSKEKILEANSFFRDAKEDDIVIFYFSGHGMIDDYGDFYLCTYNIDPLYPYEKGLRLDEIIALFSSTKSRHRLLIIDACNSGINTSMENTQNYKTSSNEALLINYLFPEHQQEGINILASSMGNEVSQIKEKYQNSIFTYALKRFLKQNNFEQYSLKKLEFDVFSEVMRITNGTQSPNLKATNLKSDFILFK